jgi:hypothetical protein
VPVERRPAGDAAKAQLERKEINERAVRLITAGGVFPAFTFLAM